AAYGSAPYDDEGVKPTKRHVVKDGILEGYFLACYSARKLGLQTTANASGPYNLFLNADLDHTEEDLDSLIKRMGTGVLITSVLGPGINIQTGDYSRGAKGFWIENGKIAYPVDGITIASNLKDMFLNIEAVAKDYTTHSNYFTGSVLIKEMQIAS
ncbi:MAG: metallopeptidase TldD-related protein, partial [Burkholderiales bacterium]|nr:metallopeptidase TldD-related protein [Burkholderiales bacterium]